MGGENKKRKKYDVDDWLYYIELVQRDRSRTRNHHSKDFRGKKNVRKHYG
ncbi:MAG: hypothetical protein ACOC5T_09720 [Elusimicrobiota bacterium]